MKKLFILPFILLFNLNCIAQYNVEVCMWEVPTRLNGILFGISETKDEADAVMYDFQKRNEGSKYDISDHPAKYKYTTLPAESFKKVHHPVNKFKYYAEKSYKVLSAEDIKGLDIAKRKGLDAGVNYYISVRGAKKDFVEKRFKYILMHLNEYRILTPSYIAVTK